MHLADVLIHDLSKIFPKLVRDQKKASRKVKEAVIIPAMDLAIQMQTAISRYRFHLPSWKVRKCPSISKQFLQKHRCLDVHTRGMLTTKNPALADRTGEIGKAILVIEPGLKRIDENGKILELRPTELLIRLDSDVQGSKQSEAIDLTADLDEDADSDKIRESSVSTYQNGSDDSYSGRVSTDTADEAGE